jgi:DNA modification methylase
MSGNLNIEYIPTAEIVPYEKNPRKNDKAVDVVVRSIKEFGFRNPIILDKDNVIIAGHTRLKAAQKIGLTEVPVIWADDLTEEQVKAFRIMDNKSMEYADWNIDLLKEEFKSLKDLDYDLSLTGFSETELNKLMPSDDMEDELPDPEKPKYDIKVGEIWQLGNHRVMCGSSTDSANVGALCGSDRANILLTDAPYNVAYSSRGLNNDFKEIENDNLSEKDFKEFLLNFAKNAPLREDCSIYLYHGDTGMNAKNFYELFQEMGWTRSTTIIWVKNVASMGWQNYRNQHEQISYGWVKSKPFFTADRSQTSIWQVKRDAVTDYKHPTQKPVELNYRAIINSSKEGDIVLDLFGGSGSTLIACQQTNRKCLMMELDPKYVSVIIERWENLTGQKAVRL